MVRMRTIVLSSNVRWTISSAKMTTAYQMFGFVMETMIVGITLMNWHLVPAELVLMINFGKTILSVHVFKSYSIRFVMILGLSVVL